MECRYTHQTCHSWIHYLPFFDYGGVIPFFLLYCNIYVAATDMLQTCIALLIIV